MFCCSFQFALESIKGLAKVPCRKGGDARKWTYELINTPLSDLLDLLCGGYKSVAICEKKEPRIMKLITSPVKKGFNSTAEKFLPRLLAGIDKIAT